MSVRRTAFCSIIALVLGFLVKFCLADRRESSPISPSMPTHDSRASTVLLHDHLASQSDALALWLSYVDLLRMPSPDWKALFREASQDHELQKLVIFHWAQHDARQCWEFLAAFPEDHILFEDLASIVISQTDPTESFRWPNEDNDRDHGLRCLAFAMALDQDWPFAFTEIAPHDAKINLNIGHRYPDWAREDPRRICHALPKRFPSALVSQAAYHFAQDDLEDAINWATGQVPGRESSAMSGIAKCVSETGSDTDLEALALRTSSAIAREVVIGGLLNQWRQTSPERANTWIENHLRGTRTWTDLRRRQAMERHNSRVREAVRKG